MPTKPKTGLFRRQSQDPEFALHRVDLSYIGTRFYGWQSQEGGGSIQDHLEDALETILRHPVRIVGSSRTDSGVHAERQVAAFYTSVGLDPGRIIKGLNALISADVGVRSLQRLSAPFDPARDATGKLYCYSFWRSVARNPMVDPFVWRVPPDVDWQHVRRSADGFVGAHDFTSFCATDSSARTRERTIHDVRVVEDGPLVQLWVLGDGFLKQMMRIMAGTLISLGRGRMGPQSVGEMLTARDRSAAGETAPAQGLTLVEVFYEDVPTLGQLLPRRGFTWGI